MDQNDRRNSIDYRSFYENKIILGPMVRFGTLPSRLLALRHGADLVYTEEIVDFKLIKSRRIVNNKLGTIDFIDEFGVIVFRTCDFESDKVILQIGTNDAKRAVLAAKMVEQDVAGIDINMGCPKSFSLKGGMGAALMENREKIRELICLLKANISRPISCKIRVFQDLSSTLDLLKFIVESGVDAIAIHGRTRNERPQHENRNHFIEAASKAFKIPIIANGDSSSINCYKDIEKFKKKTSATSVMISRAAIKNCSVFDKTNNLKSIDQIIEEYLKYAIDFENNATNTKYCLLQMLGPLQEVGKGKLLLGAYDLGTISDIYSLKDYYEAKFKKNLENNYLIETLNTIYNTDDQTVELPIAFDRTVFTVSSKLPKNILHEWTIKNNFEKPSYHTYSVEKQFHCILRFKQKNYSSLYLEKTKKNAEQSAALVLIFSIGLYQDPNVIARCWVDDDNQNSISALKYRLNNKTYLIKIN